MIKQGSLSEKKVKMKQTELWHAEIVNEVVRGSLKELEILKTSGSDVYSQQLLINETEIFCEWYLTL